MDFSSRRERAIDETKRKLQEHLEPDQVVIHIYRVVIERPNALAHWLHALMPHLDPNEARKLVAEKGYDAWDKESHGAQMDPEAWGALQLACHGEVPPLEPMCQRVMANLTTLLGTRYAAKMVEAAGSLDKLARMSQRECTRLGDERGSFGGKKVKSLMEEHELATNDRALRVLSSRTILAARLDRFKGVFKGDNLREEVYYAQ